jgi:hypothetical protein
MKEDHELGIQASITIVASAVNHTKSLSKSPPIKKAVATMASFVRPGHLHLAHYTLSGTNQFPHDIVPEYFKLVRKAPCE